MTTIIKATGVTVSGLPKLGRDICYQNDSNALTLGLMDFGNPFCTGTITNNQIATGTVLRNLVDGTGNGSASGNLPVTKNGIVMTKNDTTRALLGTGFGIKTHQNNGLLPTSDYSLLIMVWVTFDNAASNRATGSGDTILGADSAANSTWFFTQTPTVGPAIVAGGYQKPLGTVSAGDLALLSGLIYPKPATSGEFHIYGWNNTTDVGAYTANTKLYSALSPAVYTPCTAPMGLNASDLFDGKVHRAHMVKILNASPITYAKTLIDLEYSTNRTRFV